MWCTLYCSRRERGLFFDKYFDKYCIQSNLKKSSSHQCATMCSLKVVSIISEEFIERQRWLCTHLELPKVYLCRYFQHFALYLHRGQLHNWKKSTKSFRSFIPFSKIKMWPHLQRKIGISVVFDVLDNYQHSTFYS